ncbi:hypothetical protein N7523_009281 [Penicillium sp. IBT 18751x]|nr:hypothetical protein N7523_009281 [Penicillium sp. IBT 18751x]
MSDALCGPSNALQNFQKHTSVDRTLQQDRLTSRHPPAQGFRSQSPQDGILDPEFAAFEANLSGPTLPDLQHPVHFGSQLQARAPASASSGWASDFQNLHISGPPAPQLQRSNIASGHGGWQNEFMNQQQPATAHHMQNQTANNRSFQPAFAPSYPIYNAPMNVHQVPQQAHAEPSTSVQQFDESAFEAAFEQARADMELQSAETPGIQQLLHDVNSAEAHNPAQEELRIGSDTITETEKQDLQSQIRDADALAETAGQLLDSVRHEQSEKFQQSNFLALMRRIRDREVEVNGDEFREVSSP